MTKKDLTEKGKLVPQLGLFTAITIVIGSVIGSGIFKKPAIMAQQLGSPEILIAIWALAGVITLFGALSNSEVAGLIAETGGQYMFFKKMYGAFVAFLYGWGVFAVIQTGSIASITYVFAEYTEYFFKLPRFSSDIEQSLIFHIPYVGTIFPLENIGVKGLTMATIWFLTIVNYFGVKLGGWLVTFFTTLKVVAILSLVLFAFALGNGSFENMANDTSSFNTWNITTLTGIIAALSGAFWAYDGWNNITYIAGEIKRPQRNLPIALGIGTIVIIIVYMLINLAYLYILPIDQMSKSTLVAADVARLSIGSLGGAFVAAAVMISTFGTSNGTIMASSRVYFAMAREKVFFPSLGNLNQKFLTPANALFLQATWASLLVLSGTFDILTDMLIFVSWIFYAMGAYGLFILRKKMPNEHRPFKVPFYPWTPIIFTVFALVFVVVTLINDINNYAEGKTQIIQSLFGLILVAIGTPIYYYYTKIKKSED